MSASNFIKKRRNRYIFPNDLRVYSTIPAPVGSPEAEAKAIEAAWRRLNELSPEADLNDDLFYVLKVESPQGVLLSPEEIQALLKEARPGEYKDNEQKLADDADEIICPFMQHIMRKPTIAREDKVTYDHSSLVNFIGEANRAGRSTRGMKGIEISLAGILPDNEKRARIIDILKQQAKKLMGGKTPPLPALHCTFIPVNEIQKPIMWPDNPQEFSNYPNPYARFALSQLRDSRLGIHLTNVTTISGRLVFETKEETLAAQEKVTHALKAMFPAVQNDAATYRIPSDSTDRMFGVQFDWEANCIDGAGSQQENWRELVEKFGAKQGSMFQDQEFDLREITPCMTKVYAAHLILRFLEYRNNPQAAFGKEAKLEKFPSLEQQNKINISPEFADWILDFLLLKDEGEKLIKNELKPPANISNWQELETKLKQLAKTNVFQVATSRTVYDKNNQALVRFQIYQPQFISMVERLAMGAPDLLPSIAQAQKLRYRTAIRESLVLDATALIPGEMRALTHLEFKGVFNQEAFFTVKSQLPSKRQSDTPKRFLFKFDCSGSMNLWDEEQKQILKELFSEKYPGTAFSVDSVNILELLQYKAQKIAGADEKYKELKSPEQKLEYLVSKEEKYKDLVAALHTVHVYPSRMYYAKKAFMAAYQQIKGTPNARLSLLKFGGATPQFVTGFEDVDLNAPNVEEAIRSITAHYDSTWFLPGVRKMLSARKPGEELIVITISDGQIFETMGQDAVPNSHVLKQIDALFSEAKVQPILVTIGYKYNEIEEKTLEESIKSRNLIKEFIIEYTKKGQQPGSEAHTIEESHRLDEVFANKGREFVKASSQLVSLPVDSKEKSKSIKLVAYPNQYFEKTVRIPYSQGEINLPGFGTQKINLYMKATAETVASAYIAEVETKLVEKQIDPRIQGTFSSAEAKEFIKQLRQEAVAKSLETKETILQTARQAVIKFLNDIETGRFVPVAAPKLLEMTDIDKDAENCLNVLKKYEDKFDHPKKIGNFRRSQLSDLLKPTEAKKIFVPENKAFFAVDWDKTVSDEHMHEILVEKFGYPEEKKYQNVEQLWDVVKDIGACGSFTKELNLLKNTRKKFNDSLKTLSDEKEKSQATLQAIEGLNSKIESASKMIDTLVEKSWEEWGTLFRTLLKNGFAVGFTSFNAYGSILFPLFMKRKMKLTDEEIAQISIASYQLKSDDAKINPDEQYGKQPHIAKIRKDKNIPDTWATVLVDDDKSNIHVFNNEKATLKRNQDRVILAQGNQITDTMRIALEIIANKPQVVGIQHMFFPPAVLCHPSEDKFQQLYVKTRS